MSRALHLVLLAMSLIITGCEDIKTVHGIPNFKIVSPGKYRGGQPTPEGWDYLASIGVTDVVKLNLDTEGRDDHRFRIHKFEIPFSRQLVLQPDTDLIRQAVDAIKPGTYIHCSHGQDRTGLIVAEYRIRKEGWTGARAREEMLQLGFHPILFGLEGFWNTVR